MENLLKESKEFKLIFEKSLNLLSGFYNSRIKGDGLEFEDLKIYEPGDDIRKIDWNITAKENKPYLRESLEEKDVSHYILLDISASMENKFLSSQILASSLLLSTSKSRDNFSIGFFNYEKTNILEISKSKSQLMRYIYELSKIKTNGKGNLRKILLRILNQISKKSIISIITDEIELDLENKSLISIINQKHKLNYFQIFSSNEKNLEIGLNSFEDTETKISNIYDLDEKDLINYKKEFDKQLDLIRKDLLKLGVKPFLIDSDLDLKLQINESLDFL